VVKAAQSIAQAERIMESGWNPEAIISDLNLGDGREWHESFADVIRLAKGRPVAAHTAQLWHELRSDFAKRFSGQAQLFSKDHQGTIGLIEWLQQFREDQSGRMVQTMDRGSQQSGADIRAEFWLLARSLGAPHTDDTPVEVWARDIVRCVVRWQRRAEATGSILWKSLVGSIAAGAVTWISKALGVW
jgi:hypothetical protein